MQKKEIDAKVSAYKKEYLDRDIKQEIYAKFEPRILAKYNELQEWKEKFPSVEKTLLKDLN